MKKKLTKKGLFDNGSLPPFFADNFREESGKWRRIKNVDFVLIGRILSCHLVVEHYLEKYLELNTPEHLGWEVAKLTFSQKLTIAAGKKSPLHMNNLQEGIKTLNRIRNGFSHNLEATIDPKNIAILLKVIRAFTKEHEDKEALSSDLQIIETFTMMVCAFIAGWCTKITQPTEKTQTVSKDNAKRGAKG